MKINISHSLAETERIAHDWVRSISDAGSKRDEACLVVLSGHLGAGKTAFVKCVAKELGITEDVTSPTFVIMKIYDIADRQAAWKKLVHIDAYRLERKNELEAIGFDKLAADPDNLIMVEWPENVGLDTYENSLRLSFEISEGNHVIKML